MLIDGYCFKCNISVISEHLKKITNCQNCNTRLLYRCLKCKKEFDGIRHTIKHVRSPFCGPGRDLHCFICGHTTSTKNLLSHHLEVMHPNVDLANYKSATYRRCSKCGKIFKNRKSMRAHFYKCGKTPDLFCDICSFKTNHKGDLRRHVQIHLSGNRSSNENSDADEENAKSKQMLLNTFKKVLRHLE